MRRAGTTHSRLLCFASASTVCSCHRNPERCRLLHAWNILFCSGDHNGLPVSSFCRSIDPDMFSNVGDQSQVTPARFSARYQACKVLGRTGIEVFRFAFVMRRLGPASRLMRFVVCNYSLRLGLNFVETTGAYGNGYSERLYRNQYLDTVMSW